MSTFPIVYLNPAMGSARLIEEMIDPDLDEVSIVDRPATDRDLMLFKRHAAQEEETMTNREALEAVLAMAKKVPEDRDRATFERCIEHIMADPTFEPPDGKTKKEAAFAICTAGGAGEGKAAKIEIPMMPEADLTIEEPEIDTGAVIEIPASPKAWPFAKCIEAGMDLGMDQDGAIAACQLIRQDYGDPSDPDQILVPDGMKPEGLLSAAAIGGGMAKPEGMSAEVEEEAKRKALAALPEGMRMKGKNRWLGVLKNILGRDRQPTEAEQEQMKLERKVREMAQAQEKTKEDLRDMTARLFQQNSEMLRVIAASQGIQLPEQEAATATAQAAEASAPPASPPVPDHSAPAAEPAADATKADEPAAVQAAAPLTLEDLAARLEALEMENAELRMAASTDAEARAALAPPTLDVPAKAMRKSVDPTVAGGAAAKGKVEMVRSSILGYEIPKADRDAFMPLNGNRR